jgi:hypothetical protein
LIASLRLAKRTSASAAMGMGPTLHATAVTPDRRGKLQQRRNKCTAATPNDAGRCDEGDANSSTHTGNAQAMVHDDCMRWVNDTQRCSRRQPSQENSPHSQHIGPAKMVWKDEKDKKSKKDKKAKTTS